MMIPNVNMLVYADDETSPLHDWSARIRRNIP